MPPLTSVGIFWDYENCPPSGYLSTNKISGADIVRNIRSIAHLYGIVKLFKAYAELRDTSTSRMARSELQSSGVSLIDCPHNGKKNVADMMMIVDMMVFAADYFQPITIVVITADRDFAYAISTLRLRQHEVVVIAPLSQGNALTAQATAYHDWDTEVLEKPLRPHGHARAKSLDASQRGLPPVVEIQPPSPPQPQRAVRLEPPASPSPPAPRPVEVQPNTPPPPKPKPLAKPKPLPSSVQRPPTPPPALSAVARPFYPTLESYGFVSTRHEAFSSRESSSANSPLSEEGGSMATRASSQKTLLGDYASDKGKQSIQPLSEVISDEKHPLPEDAASSVFCTPLSQNSSLGHENEITPSVPNVIAEVTERSEQDQSERRSPRKMSWAQIARPEQNPSIASTSSTPAPPSTVSTDHTGETRLDQAQSTIQSPTPFVPRSSRVEPTPTPPMARTATSNAHLPFLNLIGTLQSQRAQGVLNPRSSVIAQSMTTKDVDMQAVGVDRFSQFIALAQQLGIIIISGPKGEERLTLKPRFITTVVPPTPAPTDKAAALKAQHPRFRHLIEILQEYHAKGFGRVERSLIAEQLMARHGPRIFVQLGFLNWRMYGEEAKTLGIVIYDVHPGGGHTWIRLNPEFMSP